MIPKEETSLPTPSMVKSTSNGRLSMLMNGKVNQEKENSMKSTDSTLKDHSMLFLQLMNKNMSIPMTVNHFALRLEMEEKDKSGGSTKNRTQSRVKKTINLGKLLAMVTRIKWKEEEQTHSGTNSSSMMEHTLRILR